MAACGIRLRGFRTLIFPSHRLVTPRRTFHSSCGATATSLSSSPVVRKVVRTVGVCGSDLKLGGVTAVRPYSTSTMAPIKTDGLDPTQIVDKYIEGNKIMVFSKSFCPFCHRVSIEHVGVARRVFLTF